MKPRSINSLMQYMRKEKGIKINGSSQKKKLRYMGYFHGYKGYRYCNTPKSLFGFQNFDELYAVYEFDMTLKTLLYPQIMFLEMTLKNYALEVILAETESKYFEDIYSKVLNAYKAYQIKSNKYKKAISKRMSVRNKVYNTIAHNYEKGFLVNHYYDKDQPIPIWAIFELLSLGEFGNFISCLNADVRTKISKSVGIKTAFDNDGRMLEMIVYVLKDLRNAVAHNSTVFDTRFKSKQINHRISSYITAETGIVNVTFNTIVDYIVLSCFLMKLLECSKSDIISYIRKFEKSCEDLRKKVPMNIYSKIVYTDTRNKIRMLKIFL